MWWITNKENVLLNVRGVKYLRFFLVGIKNDEKSVYREEPSKAANKYDSILRLIFDILIDMRWIQCRRM